MIAENAQLQSQLGHPDVKGALIETRAAFKKLIVDGTRLRTTREHFPAGGTDGREWLEKVQVAGNKWLREYKVRELSDLLQQRWEYATGEGRKFNARFVIEPAVAALEPWVEELKLEDIRDITGQFVHIVVDRPLEIREITTGETEDYLGEGILPSRTEAIVLCIRDLRITNRSRDKRASMEFKLNVGLKEPWEGKGRLALTVDEREFKPRELDKPLPAKGWILDCPWELSSEADVVANVGFAIRGGNLDYLSKIVDVNDAWLDIYDRLRPQVGGIKKMRVPGHVDL